MMYIQTMGITRSCRDDVRRVLADPSHVPRWSKRNEQSKYSIKSCSDVSFVSSNLADRERMNQLIKQIAVEIECNKIPIPDSQPLCVNVTIYNLIQQQNNCQRAE